ncbi:hypothetical protein FKW77_007299 [Venturia effusa]|uniref:RNA helicase n=1 Tax=Venturia effusa TaxID=50376 RepID=A0A517LKI1_9PEZI|nr:hypothetical protein FKW77_007299 [Venturia effusa]
MAGAPNPLYQSKWAPLIPEPALVAAAAPPPRPASPRRAQTVAQLRRGASATNRQDDEDLIMWDSDSSEGYKSSVTSDDEDQQIIWDDDDAIVWDYSSSEDGETTEDEAAEDTMSGVSSSNTGLSSASTPGPQSKDPYSFVTRKFPTCAANNTILNFWKANPVNKFQGGLETSRWAVPSGKPVTKPNTAAPRRPAAAFALTRPQNAGVQRRDAMPNGSRALSPPFAAQLPAPPVAQARQPPALHTTRNVQSANILPQHDDGLQYQPMLFARNARGFGSCDPLPPAQAVVMVAAQNKPPSLPLDAPKSVPAPYFHAPSLRSQSAIKATAPTYLDYSIAPSVSSLVSNTVKRCSQWIRPRNGQIERDEEEIPEHNYHKSETLSEEEKAERNKELEAHAKTLKRNLTNTKVGLETSRSKAEMTINQQRDRILQLITANAAVVIAAATGSGKTTQLPQIILEDAIASGVGADCNIWVTQPRRVAATSVARRVIKERFDGGVISVGHHVKFDVRLPRPGGCITYCTTGILLNRIQRRPGEVFDNVSHIIVDEAHERDMLIDRLLAILKFHLFTRKKAGLKFPKVIVSSATLDIDLFTKYFAQPMMRNGVRELLPCPYLDIPGRMFPVKYTYLTDILLELQKYPPGSRFFMEQEKATKDYLQINKEVPFSKTQLQPLQAQTDAQEAIVPAALIALTIAHIISTTTEGAILVFLPGLDSINKVRTSLEVNSPMIGVDFGNGHAYRIMILHSDMKDSNDEAFDTMPRGVRKIVLATNIAETSITIPDAVYVIDSGKHKEMVYDHERGLSQLRCGWISQSSCKQRAGRSGRIRNGFYYAMYTKQRFDAMRPTTQPEILRSELQEVCLQLAHQPFDTSVRDFLDSLIEPPDHKAVDAAFVSLKDIDALTDDEQITALGRVLASLPVHPARAKMIVLGIVFRCLDPMLILAAANSMKDMFLRPLDRRQESKAARIRFSADSNSDHLALINAFDQARALGESQGQSKCRRFLGDNFVHFNQWREVCRTAELMEQILIDRRLIPWFEPGGDYWRYGSPELNTNSSNQHLIKALIIAGFHPNVAASHGLPMMRSLHANRILMGSGSVNQDMMKLAQRGQLYTFTEIAKSADGNAWTMRDNSAISPLGVILFARNLKRIGDRQLLVDSWLQFTLPSEDEATALVHFKNIVDNILADAYSQLGGVQKHIADDPLRENISSVIGISLFQDTKAYEEWLENQPPVPKGKKKRRLNPHGGGQNGQNGRNGYRGPNGRRR